MSSVTVIKQKALNLARALCSQNTGLFHKDTEHIVISNQCPDFPYFHMAFQKQSLYISFILLAFDIHENLNKEQNNHNNGMQSRRQLVEN